MLYEDWLQADGDWCKSSIYFNAMEKSSSRKRGKWGYMTVLDVQSKYGNSIAADIKKKKLELQENKQEGEDNWYMKHPDVPHPDSWSVVGYI
jgi:hypothetical protein